MTSHQPCKLAIVIPLLQAWKVKARKARGLRVVSWESLAFRLQARCWIRPDKIGPCGVKIIGGEEVHYQQGVSHPGTLALTFPNAFTPIVFDPVFSKKDCALLNLQKTSSARTFSARKALKVLNHSRINALNSVFIILGRKYVGFSCGLCF
jgi:hypothetical protein